MWLRNSPCPLFLRGVPNGQWAGVGIQDSGKSRQRGTRAWRCSFLQTRVNLESPACPSRCAAMGMAPGGELSTDVHSSQERLASAAAALLKQGENLFRGSFAARGSIASKRPQSRIVPSQPVTRRGDSLQLSSAGGGCQLQGEAGTSGVAGETGEMAGKIWSTARRRSWAERKSLRVVTDSNDAHVVQ